jgi:glucose-1-phosphate cytidylyltransferase
MRYYAHYGHKDFILCLGHGAQKIKDYFLQYDECSTNDFVLSNGGADVELLSTDIDDWTITFVDTGTSSLIGERLRRVRQFLQDDEYFLANYADGLSDLPLDEYIDGFIARNKTACFLSVPAPHTFHIVHADDDNHVTHMEHVSRSPVRINAGFFVLGSSIFDVIEPGDELVLEPFDRLIQRQELLAIPYDGFWRNMDTFKDKIQLDEIDAAGSPPWKVWTR